MPFHWRIIYHDPTEVLSVEVNQAAIDVTDYLREAIEHEEYPKTHTAACRGAMERIVLTIYEHHFGIISSHGEEWKHGYKMERIKSHITSRIYNKIQDVWRQIPHKLLHYSRENPSENPSIDTNLPLKIQSLFQEIFGEKLSIGNVDVKTFEIGGELEADYFCTKGMEAERKGRYFLTIGFYYQALQLYQTNDNLDAQATMFLNLGHIYSKLHQLEESERCYLASIAVVRSQEDDDGSHTRRQWLVFGQSMSGLGNLYFELGKLEEATDLFNDAYQIQKRIGDQMGEADTLHFMGNLLLSKSRFQEARAFFERAMAIQKGLDNLPAEAALFNSIARSAYIRGDQKSAKRLLARSIEMNEEVGNRHLNGENLHHLALIAQEDDNHSEAVKLCRESLVIYIENDYLLGQAKVHERLGESYLKLDDVEKSEQHYRDSVRILVSISYPLTPWMEKNGYTDPDFKWDFPPKDD